MGFCVGVGVAAAGRVEGGMTTVSAPAAAACSAATGDGDGACRLSAATSAGNGSGINGAGTGTGIEAGFISITGGNSCTSGKRRTPGSSRGWVFCKIAAT